MPVYDRAQHLPYEVDCRAFVEAVYKAARDMGCSVASMCRELGISQSTLSEIRNTSRDRRSLRYPLIINLAAWSGVELKPFIVNKGKLQPLKMSEIQPQNYQQALQVIEALRTELAAK